MLQCEIIVSSDRALMTQGYYVTKEIFGLCRLRGADPDKYPDQAAWFKLPPWLFAIAVSLYCAYYDPGLKRIFAHLAETRDAKEMCAVMLKTAEELNFDMPHLTAAAAHWQNV